MDWTVIEASWPHFKGNALRHFREISDQQMDTVRGSREQLVESVRLAYATTPEDAERRVANWQAAQREGQIAPPRQVARAGRPILR